MGEDHITIVRRVYEAAPDTWHWQLFEEFHGEQIFLARSLRAAESRSAADAAAAAIAVELLGSDEVSEEED